MPKGPLFPKTGKRMRTKKQADAAIDRVESAKVSIRSEGRCEVVTIHVSRWLRCRREGTQVHHMIGGNGKRGRGLSGWADHKQHVCDTCHLGITGDIGGKTLVRVGGTVPHWTDTYMRRRA